MELRALLLLLVVPFWNVAGGQASSARILNGRVADSTGQAIQFANVKALPDGLRIVAGTDGRFAFEVDASVREVEIRRIGFEPRVIATAAWPDTALHIVLAALPARLERVRVEARQQIQSLVLQGFYERQAQLQKGINSGFMITPEEIDQRKGARVTDFLLGHPGIKVATVRPQVPGQSRSLQRAGLQPQGANGCRMEIYVDGLRFYTTRWPPSPADAGRAEYVNDFIPMNDIAAIEVYPRGVGAPPKYQSMNGPCGVILIWTK